ncbi:unnamed protein product [Amoebophrya sp. A120]|nr:unnamed protein product [Amoebophrya sp. A120]|eukprot:GSA120T00021521001.1
MPVGMKAVMEQQEHWWAEKMSGNASRSPVDALATTATGSVMKSWAVLAVESLVGCSRKTPGNKRTFFVSQPLGGDNWKTLVQREVEPPELHGAPSHSLSLLSGQKNSSSSSRVRIKLNDFSKKNEIFLSVVSKRSRSSTAFMDSDTMQTADENSSDTKAGPDDAVDETTGKLLRTRSGRRKRLTLSWRRTAWTPTPTRGTSLSPWTGRRTRMRTTAFGPAHPRCRRTCCGRTSRT